MTRAPRLVALAVVAAGCFDDQVIGVDAAFTTPDRGVRNDLGSLDDHIAPEGGMLDDGDGRDAATTSPDAPREELPDAPAVTADLGPRCATSTDCTGACVDVQVDVANCGMCTRRCTASNGVPACTAGVCGIEACTPGFADCDADAANGCETDLRTSAASCGRCGAVCTVSGGTPACVDAACTVATCGGSFANCDGSAANGCETDTRRAVTHCGACGRACPAAPNATATCAAGACGLQCAPSYADCDGAAANGCEVDLATSPSHCGACGALGAETCDGRDNSCDGVADNGCPTSFGGLATFDYTSPEYGDGTGILTNAMCPAGAVVRGVYGWVNGGYITQLNVTCGRPQIAEDRSTTPYRYNATVSGATDVGTAGTASGTPFRYRCPGDSVVTRIRGRTATFLYQFMVECSTLAVTGNPGALRVTATAAATSPGFGAASGTPFDYVCPTNAAGSASVLRGLFGRRNILRSNSTSVGARCGVPAITVR